MARYLEVAAELNENIKQFVASYLPDLPPEAAVQLGHIVNLAVRCCPRPVQGTVRKNIVEKAVGDWCRVTMTKGFDERTQKSFNKINIIPKQ